MSNLLLKNYLINCFNIFITLVGFLYFKITKKSNFFINLILDLIVLLIHE